MLHGQSNVVGGDGEEALQLGVCTQLGFVGLQKGPQSAVAHIFHDQNVRLCTFKTQREDGGLTGRDIPKVSSAFIYYLSTKRPV